MTHDPKNLTPDELELLAKLLTAKSYESIDVARAPCLKLLADLDAAWGILASLPKTSDSTLSLPATLKVTDKRMYRPRTITEAGELVGFAIDNPDGSALLIKCAGGTNVDEAWKHMMALADAANSDRAEMVKELARLRNIFAELERDAGGMSVKICHAEEALSDAGFEGTLIEQADAAATELGRLRDEEGKMREALKFYADPNNHREVVFGIEMASRIFQDNGDIARAAIANKQNCMEFAERQPE